MDHLAYYAAHGAALFPIPAGQKAPFGLVASFKHDYSTDPAQWQKWATAHPGCNFGVVAFASQWIIVDIDTSGPAGREEAWALWCSLCASWGIAPFSPTVQSARGGWHAYFSVPPDIDASRLRQPDAVKSRINIRCVGYTVAAGSTFEGQPYQLLSDAPPHPAPAALIAHCTRTTKVGVTKVGVHEYSDVHALYEWLVAKDAFASYEDWLSAGMVSKVEFGDAGFALWELTHDETVDPDLAASKWDSFSDIATSDSQALGTLLTLARRLGWTGNIRKSATAMFGTVAQIAASAGASLSGAATTATTGSLFAGQEELTRRCEPILKDFLAGTHDAPTRPISDDIIALPEAMNGHGLYADLNDVIQRTVAMAEPTCSLKWKPGRIKSAMAVLLLTQPDIFDAVRRRIEAMGRSFPIGPIKIEAKGIEDDVQRTFVKQDDWIYDARSGLPESDNPDNIVVFLAIIGAEVRWNAWMQRAEIRGFEWLQWSPIDDVIIAKLKVRALRTKTRFRIGNEFLKETLLATAHANPHDPVVEHIAGLIWDGTPRLASWLHNVTGVPADDYHAAVGTNVIGGMVKRARKPGAKHDEVMILLGPQGTMKSSMCRVLAMKDDWFTDSVTFEGSPQNIVPQLFGKLVCELGELDGMARREVQHVKAFITRQTDNVTLKYKAFASDHPRRCIFIGSSNDEAPLADLTGNRRFLPVRVTSELNIGWLEAHIEQLVAEAAVREAAGETFSMPRDVWTVAATHQEAARAVSDIESRLCEWFAEGVHTAVSFIALSDLIELCDMAGWKSPALPTLRNSIMKRLGFAETSCNVEGHKKRVLYRGPKMVAGQIEKQTRYMIGKTSDNRPRVTIRQQSVPRPPC